MLDLLIWYVVLCFFALAALPLGWTWLRHLPDRGWGLLRPLGLLLSGFFVWFLGSFGLLRLSPGSGLGAGLLLFGLGIWVLHRWGGGWAALRVWLREERQLLLVEETIFLTLVLFWSWYRAHDIYGIGHTEQPMDFAFLKAILRGGELPPNDPWLSGFAISYYYLGYLIMAQITALSGVASGVAYNLGLATLAAMAATGAFSIAYNLLLPEAARSSRGRNLAVPLALLAPLLLVGISNLTGLLTMFYHQGWGSPELFRWLAVPGLTVDPVTSERVPQSGWWWWDASRTILDLDAAGNRLEVIDEFPFFSFLLGDMHPHVLALPFLLLGLAVALNALRGAFAAPRLRTWRRMLLSPESWNVGQGFGFLCLLLSMILLGAMGMINTWDFPTLATVLVGVWLLAVLFRGAERKGKSAISAWLRGTGALVGGALLLYLPFYLGFQSQADGIRFSSFSTLPQQYLLMFGLFWAVLLPFALTQVREVMRGLRGIRSRVATLGVLMLVVDGVVLLFLLRLPVEEGQLALLLAGFWLSIPLLLFSLTGAEDPTPLAMLQLAGFPLVAALLAQRWTTAMIAALLALVLLALWVRARVLIPEARAEDTTERLPSHSIIAGGSHFSLPSDVALARESRWTGRVGDQTSLLFALFLVAIALLLTMGTELFYIKDGFGGRMNTVFKLYYQAWTLMALASPFALYYAGRRVAPLLRVPWLVLVVLLLVGSLWYPIEGVLSKANWEAPAEWDGRFWMARSDPDRFAAIQWLDALPGQVVVLEAPGNSYMASESALAGWTGHSTLVGWAGHELQWRGSYEEVARREPVIEEIYTSTDPALASQLVEQWEIDYVAVTPHEVERYALTSAQIEKFNQFMSPVFQQGSVTLYGR